MTPPGLNLLEVLNALRDVDDEPLQLQCDVYYEEEHEDNEQVPRDSVWTLRRGVGRATVCTRSFDLIQRIPINKEQQRSHQYAARTLVKWMHLAHIIHKVMPCSWLKKWTGWTSRRTPTCSPRSSTRWRTRRMPLRCSPFCGVCCSSTPSRNTGQTRLLFCNGHILPCASVLIVCMALKCER